VEWFRFALSLDIPATQIAIGRLLSGANGHEGQGLALLALGQGARGLAQLDSAAVLYRTPEARFQALEWRVIPSALGLPLAPAAEIAQARAALRDWTGDPARGARAAWALALDAFGRHDAAGVERWAAVVRDRASADSAAARLDQLLRALHAAALSDGLRAIAISDSLRAAYAESRGGDPFARAVLHVERATWYETLGRAAEADREWLWYENADIQGFPTTESQSGEVDWVFGVYARLRRGALALSRGDTRRGCEYLKRVLELWAGADAELAELAGRAQRLSAACPR